MANWGYTIIKDNQIDFDKGNHDFFVKIAASEPSFNTCISCGACAATCSTNNFSEGFNLRKMNVMVSRGQQLGLLEELKKCMLCGKCTLVCPRGVNTRHIIILLKELLIKNIH